MKRLLFAGLGVVVVLVAAVVIWLAFIREDAPEAFTLSETADASDVAETPTEVVSLDGTWTVTEGSEAGYRVVEDVGDVLDFEAVGRTSQVTGSIEIGGSSVTAGSFEVDIASMTSGDSRRDGQFVGPIMNATEFPTATFALTEPIELSTLPSGGEAVSATATGELMLRGATNAVTFPVQAQLLGTRIELVGSIDVLFSDYGIDNPSNPLVEVRDEGKVEVLLMLAAG